MRRVRNIVVAVFCLVAVVWLIDLGSFRYRVFRNRNPYGGATVYEYYAIGEKNQRTEYVYKSTERETCANALFPRAGFPPCWYARRHTEKQVKI